MKSFKAYFVEKILKESAKDVWADDEDDDPNHHGVITPEGKEVILPGEGERALESSHHRYAKSKRFKDIVDMLINDGYIRFLEEKEDDNILGISFSPYHPGIIDRAIAFVKKFRGKEPPIVVDLYKTCDQKSLEWFKAEAGNSVQETVNYLNRLKSKTGK